MKQSIAGFFAITLLIATPASAGPMTAEQILANADEARNPQLDYTMAVRVTNYKPKRSPAISTFKTYVKGREKSVVLTLMPQIDRGRVLLMNGRNFWGFLPNVSKPLRISLQERLTGEVANGDLARTNFKGDYAPVLQGTKIIKNKKFDVLDLKAKSEDVTYGRVVLLVEKGTFRPYQAEFYAFSGRLLKTCSYGDFKPFGGAVRPTRLVMRDAVNKEDVSTLEYSDIKVAPLQEKLFTKDYMKKLTDE